MSADACGDTGKATKYPDSANNKEDGMQLHMYIKCVDVHVCEIAVTRAILAINRPLVGIGKFCSPALKPLAHFHFPPNDTRPVGWASYGKIRPN